MRPRSQRRLLAAAALLAALAVPVAGQRTAPDQPATRAQAQEIIRELARIRALLQRMAPAESAAPHLRLRLDSAWPALGKPSAPLTIVEFEDLQCPDCRAFERDEFTSLSAEFIRTGKTRFVGVDITAPQFPYSLQADAAARCAGDQGKYWKYRDALLRQSGETPPAQLEKLAAGLVPRAAEFNRCLRAGLHDGDIAADNAAALRLRVRGTPSFLIGAVEQGRLSGVLLRGAPPWPRFRQILDHLLSGATPHAPASDH